MISINEQEEVFTFVNHEIHTKSATFMQAVKELGGEFTRLTTADVQNEGIWPDRFYYIVEGNISAEYDGKELYLFEKGDIILHSTIEDVEETGLYYSVMSEVVVDSIPVQELYQLLATDAELIGLWVTITSLNQLQLNQMVGVLTEKEERANPGFGRYKAGMAIITEGEDAEYVYSISEGTAVAIHKDIEVGEINKDEIFGAIAVLTDQKRTASVIAKTDCIVLMVHKDEFSKMVKSHPKLFLNILTSLAEKITALNAKFSRQVS
ncbi:MAG: cyclic nucleotide-binding domain-containing protein [Kangiellaceae bacterium]|nr:cyclic nucleotide-binding domain-containing protein [Kangiellaceae bacterium]